MGYYLKLLSRTDVQGPIAPRLAKYMITNRKHGSYWDSTRDTAVCIEALADYIKASGEDKPDMTVAIAHRRQESERSAHRRPRTSSPSTISWSSPAPT